jgi:hypothetical protein
MKVGKTAEVEVIVVEKGVDERGAVVEGRVKGRERE